MSKQAGRMSQGANDFLAPYAPTIGTATNVGTNRGYNDGAATVTFTASGPNTADSFTAYAVEDPTKTATGSSSPLTVTGLTSTSNYTFKVYGTNTSGGKGADSSASNQVTVTTVPATPSAPSASSPSAGIDSVSWTAPANGGSAITNYHWESNDSKSGDTGTGTSVNVNQEQGTAQQYRVYATNANGNSAYSGYSPSVTTTFSFTPFGFTPFGFTPFGAFGFVPFGFTPFGFTPMFAAFGAFGAFGFTPMFGAFGAFSAFGFTPAPMFGAFGFFNSVSILTEVLVAGAPGSTKLAGDLQVGDVLLGVDMGTNSEDWLTWQSSDLTIDRNNIVETTIVAITREVQDQFIYIDGDLFSRSHYILVKKNGVTRFIKAVDIDTTFQIFSPETAEFVDISLVETVYMNLEKVSINCEPHDNFFTKKMLVFDRPDSQI